MAFDPENAQHRLVLKNEEALDPIGMGYAAVDGQLNKTLDLFNDSDKNVELPKPVKDTPLTPEILLQVIDVGEYKGNQVGDGRSLVDLFIQAGVSILEVDLEQFRDKIKSLFPGNGPTVASINALKTDLSRAEAMEDPAAPGSPIYGAGTFISKNDWFAARDS